MDKINKLLHEELKSYEIKDQVLLQLKYNITSENFLDNYLQVLNEEEIQNNSFTSLLLSKETILNIYNKLINQEETDKILLLVKRSLSELKEYENNFLLINYVTAYNFLIIFYENILFSVEFTNEFYKQIVESITNNFVLNLEVILMNINYFISLKLDSHNGVLNGMPPTKKIKQLRLIEYAQNYVRIIQNLTQNDKQISKELIEEYGYMLKVLKNNRKSLIDFEKVTFQMNKEYKLLICQTDTFNAFKKALNPNYEEKFDIINQEMYNNAFNISKDILIEYNNANGIKPKKRKNKRGKDYA